MHHNRRLRRIILDGKGSIIEVVNRGGVSDPSCSFEERMDQIDEHDGGYDESDFSSQDQSLSERSQDSEQSDSIDISAEDTAQSSDGASIGVSAKQRDARRSYQSAVTPRQKNKSSESKFSNSAHSEKPNSLVSVPFRQEHLTRSGQSQASLVSMNSKASHVTFHQDAPDDASEPSLHLKVVYGQVSPGSTLTASFVKRSPDVAQRARRQIAMDGSITSLQLTSGAESETAASTTAHHADLLRVPNSPSKRTREAMNKSYFAAAQELFSDHLSDGSAPAESTPVTNPNRDHSVDTDDADDFFDPITCCGFVCPVLCTSLVQGAPSLNQISRFLVNILPCFWFCSRTAMGATSDRAVLARLNILCLFMTSVQLAMSMWLTFTLLILDDGAGLFRGFAPHFWNCNGATFSIGILAFILMLTCSFTIRVIKEVDFVRAIRCLWIVLWILPFEIFFNISLYDYYNVTEVWIRHWWLDDNMSWFRFFFCEKGTENNTCLVPIDGGAGYKSEAAWCMAFYESTECTQVRDAAQAWMQRFMLTFYTGLAGWSSVFLGLLMLMVHSLQHIITKPMVQKSRESNVPAWLFLPTLTNTMVGGVLHFSPSSLLSESSSSGNESSWIGVAYLVVAGLFFAALLTGWFVSAFTIRNHGDKQTKAVAVVAMIFMMATNVAILAAVFFSSVLHASSLLNSPIAESERGVVACRVDRGASCTMCDEMYAGDRCPEWTLDEVTQIMQTQLKQTAALAAIFVLYAISVLRFGITLRKHLALYQIDYV